jgi:peroxiredoxin
MLVLALSLFACAQKSDVDALDARLKTLEEKVEAQAARTPAAPTPPDPAKEEAASAIMKEATEALKLNDFTTAKAKLSTLKAEHATTKAGKAAERMYKEVGLIGENAAPIETEKWLQGKAVSYDDAPVTLLVFWEVWCPHCKREMPELAKREADLKKKGVQVVGFTKISKSATEESVAAFLKENDIKFPNGKEKDASMSAGFNVSGIPAAAMVKNGKVIWRGHPGRLDDATIDKLISG